MKYLVSIGVSSTQGSGTRYKVQRYIKRYIPRLSRMSGLKRDGAAKLVSRDQILRRERR